MELENSFINFTTGIISGLILFAICLNNNFILYLIACFIICILFFLINLNHLS